MADHSDYSKNRINVLKFLEGTTFDTDVNRSLIENTFNRFLTKDETVEAIGTVGAVDRTVILNRQLKEDTVHRQTYQLQPVVHKKVATVDYTMSFKDILAELERLGVDLTRMKEWADTESFNFAPPVDLDKLVNFRDYYWYDEDGQINKPQYVTIQNRCRVATSRVSQRRRDIAGIGAQLPLIAINILENEFVITNDVTNVFLAGTVFDVSGSETIEGQYTVSKSYYKAGKTHIIPEEQIPTNLYNGGYLSFDSQIALLTAAQNRACGSSAGWDVGLWDDANPVTAGPSVTAPVQLAYLRDESPDLFAMIVRNHPEYLDLKGEIIEVSARPLWSWMDGDKPEFISGWDAVGNRTILNNWQIDNKWVHKLDLPPGAFSKSTRAEAPIIDYLPNLQLNAWSEVRHNWLYREDPIKGIFAPAAKGPSNADYAAPDFLDKWIYVGRAETVPTEPQPENPDATLMSTDITAASRLSTFSTFTITAINTTNRQVTFDGVPPVAVNDIIRINNVDEFLSPQVQAVAIINGQTRVTLNSVASLSVGNKVFVPTTATFDAVIFPAGKQKSALADTNAARVYLDEQRYVGAFTEITVKNTTNNHYYVGGLMFDDALSTERLLDVGIDPIAAVDGEDLYEKGNRSVWLVRTPEYMDDKAYAEADKPTETICAVSFFKHEQTKEIGESKVPVFDLFNANGTTANKASPLFFYEIDQSAKINKHTGFRMKTSESGEVFYFNQMLIDYDNGPMLCYKDLDTIGPNNVNGLQTIWRTDLRERYVPKFVDVDRREDGEVYYDSLNREHIAKVDASNGDWEILSQLVYNVSHENRKTVSSTELFEHIKTLLRAQDTLEGFLPSQYGFRLLDEINYAVGGTIKEHNGSFDTLVSSIFVNGSTPVSVIKFAESAYETALSALEDYVVANAFAFLVNKSPEYISDLAGSVIDAAIESYEINDNNNVVFGDSTTYTETGKGVRNWPATIPFMGFGKLYTPTHIVDKKLGIDEILHHDGHYGRYYIADTDVLGVARRLLRTSYTDKNTTRFYAWSPSQAADGGDKVATYSAIPWDRLRPGDAWVEGPTFKRFEVVAISHEAPSAQIKDGSFWLRQSDAQLMVKTTVDGVGMWVTGPYAPGDVSAAWKDVDLSNVLNSVVFEVERRLYEAALEVNPNQVLPESLYIRNELDQSAYATLRRRSFEAFLRERQINTPYASEYLAADPFTWNYTDVDANYKEDGIYMNVWSPFTTNRDIPWVGYWAGLYRAIYGTSYPHREPWVLQGFDARPTWWDEEYADTTGTRKWKARMWTNVLSNRIPAEYDAPSRVLYREVDASTGIEYKIMEKKFTYVPVNITRPILNAAGTVTYYDLDDLFPPYDSRMFQAANLDIMSGDSIGKPLIRRPEAIRLANLKGPFAFGDVAPIEWEWVKSTDSKYSRVENAFLMQPIRFMDSTWGVDYVTIGGLRINAQTNKVFSHHDTIFHGDVVDGKVYKVSGLNQWYVNYNRSSGLDFKVSNFREMWTEWESQLAYQFGCFINTKSFDVSSSSYDMIKEDYAIVAKKSPGYDSVRADSLQITVANYGSSKVRGGLKIPTGDGYSWEFLVNIPSSATELEYYDVRKYQYTVVDAEQGLLQLVNGTVPWKDGDEVYIYSTQYAPYPMDPAWNYYVSTVEGNVHQFKLSRKKADALAKVGTFLRTTGEGVQMVGEIVSTFGTVTDGVQQIWKHNALDRAAVRTVSVPFVVQGVQGLIDFIDGYAARLEDKGIRANHTSVTELDPETGRLVSWQTEIERCIGKIYDGIGVNNTSVRQYGITHEFVVQDPTQQRDVFELVNTPEFPFTLGQEVYAFTSGATPTGMMLNTPYYVMPVEGSVTQFRLASTAENAFDDIAINIESSGIGKQYIGAFASSFVAGQQYVEVNPFRNNIWITTDRGVVANVFDGGSADSNREVTIYDQYARPLPKGSVTVLREDKLTRVTVRPQMNNDVSTDNENGYNYIHIGGVKFYIDGFEHVVLFNNYTTEGYLIYDPFIGMDVTRLNVSFNRSINKSLRPSLGGYYQDTGEMIRNLEASVTDMRSYYDTYGGTSVSDYLTFSRALLGYEDPTYLDQLNTPERAKFLFWKGMIQRKGSKAAINAFINSKHFVDARVDDFWAYKVADFGDARQKYKPEMKIRVSDSYASDLRYEFAEIGEATSPRFQAITYADDTRFIDPARVKSEMKNSALYFDAEQSILQANIVTIGSAKYLMLPQRLDGVRVEYTGMASPLTVASGGLSKINDRVYRVVATIPDAATSFLIGYTPAASKLDPVEIIDGTAGTTIVTSKTWDPLNGLHYYAPLKDVNFMAAADPAVYDEASSAWTTQQVGKVWVDTSTIGYVPYDDTTVFPEFNDRMARWGRLAAWSKPIVYEWVRSSRAPADFEAAAPTEEGDALIATTRRASGVPLKMWTRITTGETVDMSPIHTVVDVAGTIAAIKASPNYAGLEIEYYVNGISQGRDTVQDLSAAALNYTTGAYITFVPVVPMDSELFTQEYKYVSVLEADENGNDVTVYYFWAQNRNVPSAPGKMTASQIANQIAYPGAPYHIYQNFKEASGAKPARYNRIVIRSVAQMINDDNRYVARFTRDFTLRDDLAAGKSALDLKNKHAEWVLFREKQPYKISQSLWNKMAEALIGYEIDGFDDGVRTPVPSMAHALYDQYYGTTTRFGMSKGQAFVDRAQGIRTVQQLLESADFDTAPIDKHVFLDLYTFDTPVNIKRSLAYIFTNFSDTSVNRMFFEVLHDALSNKLDFPGMIMTSFMALHGIKILETSGMVAE